MQSWGAEAVLQALDEDRQTAWAPDPLGGLDALATVDDALTWPVAIPKIEILQVPKPDGTHLAAPVLPLQALVAIHVAVAPLKDVAEAALSSGVCGYRRGAEPGRSYAEEHRRFVEMSQAEMESATAVLIADVRRFFQCSSWDQVLSATEPLVAPDATKHLRALAADFSSAGLGNLPAGHADARFLGNLLLAPADAEMGGRFARWVDDYRVFVSSKREAAGAASRLAGGLARQGLQLHHTKTITMDPLAAQRHARESLQSVYHPDVESQEQVRSALRSVFASAAAEPISKRRSLRFAIRRLAAERDEVAVAWSIAMLTRLPWEAPRIVGYLSHFADREDVRSGVQRALCVAIEHNQSWLAIRLAAFASHMTVDSPTADVIRRAIGATDSPALWGILLRTLSQGDHADAVLEELDRRSLDPRAALAALKDLDVRFPRSLASAAPRTAAMLRDERAPRPIVESLL